MSRQDDTASGFEPFDHTADVGLRVWADSLEVLFEQAAAGFLGMMLDPVTVRQVRTVPVSAEGLDPEDLLVSWLGEILYAFDAERFAPAVARVVALTDREVRGELCGEDFDPRRHVVRQAVKAVTYHDLRIVKVPDGYEVRIVFDV